MQDLINEMVHRMQEEHPDAVAILLKGSHARGDAGSWSDVDFDVLVSTPDTEIYRTWIVPNGERLVHVSAAVENLQGWLDDANEPSPWSLGLPTTETTRVIWAIDNATWQLLDHPHKLHPAADPEVEDAMEGLGKLRTAVAKNDVPGGYRSAEKLAKLIPTLLVPINPHTPVSNSRQAIAGVMSLPNVPEGFLDDWLTCIGYVDSRSLASTLAAAERMFLGVMAMLPPDPEVVGEDIARIMADGSLLRYVQQESGNQQTEKV